MDPNDNQPVGQDQPVEPVVMPSVPTEVPVDQPVAIPPAPTDGGMQVDAPAAEEVVDAGSTSAMQDPASVAQTDPTLPVADPVVDPNAAPTETPSEPEAPQEFGSF